MNGQKDDGVRVKDSSFVESIASELTLHLSTCGATCNGGSQEVLDHNVRSAIRQTLEQLMDGELDKASRPHDGAVGVDVRRVAEAVSRTSPTYADIREAVQQCAVRMASQESFTGRQKKQRSIDQSQGGSNSDGGTKSFSLFDMLDRQPLQMERVCADKILNRYKEGVESGVVDWDDIASLLENVEDIEDIIADPFSGSVWDEVRNVLGTCLAQDGVSMRFVEIHSKLASLCDKSQNPAETSQQLCDLTMNVLDSLLEFPPHSRTLGRAGDNIIVPEVMSSFVQSFESMVVRLVAVLDCLMGDDLDLFLKKTMLLVAQRVDGADPSHVLTIMALNDPYADWFSMLLRELPAIRVMGFATEAGVLPALLSRCHSYGAISGINNIEGTGPISATACCHADLRHAFYLQSLSMLQRIIDSTDGSPDLIPYVSVVKEIQGASSGDRKSADGEENLIQSVEKFLLPYQKTLLIGVDGGECCVDQDLARMCGAAVETILMGLSRNHVIFVKLFSSFGNCLVRAVMKIGPSDSLAPSSVEFLRICRNVLVYTQFQERTKSDVADAGVPSSFTQFGRLLGALLETMGESASLGNDCLDSSILRDIKKVLEGIKM